ncbi:thiamine-phosphate kinase [Hyphomicrobium sp.]|uniref:thiamine-phosphate kinase n=1 Tax=Hyphomicrobium sp. TaxID=82 RepID=UPI000F9DBCFC|nr:thiamine-phosphate kinase [Hyphomicrobium sp.]RUO97904.1 MAG: thiamine-phosphate kinase [Hyphomicrobium sp.]
MPTTPDPSETDRIGTETELIQDYLAPLTNGDPGAFDLRDDAALLAPAPGQDLVFTSDPIIAGVHFLPTESPADIAWKALAVNVSDLAAKGARPISYVLNLAFPESPRRAWMAAFSAGLKAAQESFGCHLIGGDTDVTPGPLSIGVTIIGSLPSGSYVPRQGARKGDHVFVTGTIGDAALGLKIRLAQSGFDGLDAEQRDYLVGRYLRPSPRLALGDTLRAHASAALDVSDGLLKDLKRLAGPLGVLLSFDRVPLSDAAAAAIASDPSLFERILCGGDDYELLIAVPPALIGHFRRGAASAGVAVTDLGILEENIPVHVLASDGTPMDVSLFGYDHFSR